MIKFFRRIRQRLLTENKPAFAAGRLIKYLLYAIGEIVLVVIGILIALQLNIWNENRKNKIKESQFLISFKDDLNYNIKELDGLTKRSEYGYTSADSILQLSYGNIQNESEWFLSNHIISSSTLSNYKTQEGTIQDVLGSGHLGLITNDSIRLAIASWEANLKPIREWEVLDSRANDQFINHIKQFIHLDKILSYNAKIPEDIKSQLLKDLVFLNTVTELKIFTDALNRLYKNEQSRLEQLINAINTDLKRFE